MEALGITVLFSVVLGLIFMVAFAWDHSARRGEDRERDALRPLDEDSPPRAR